VSLGSLAPGGRAPALVRWDAKVPTAWLEANRRLTPALSKSLLQGLEVTELVVSQDKFKALTMTPWDVPTS
jgi:hypothetical protein